MKKLLFLLMVLAFITEMKGQAIPFNRDIDMQNNNILNVDSLNGVPVENLTAGYITFDLTYWGINPTDISVASNIRHTMEISSNVTIQLYNTENKLTVVSWYLVYTGQPTISILPPSGYDIMWGFGNEYTGPSSPNIMDKIIIETFDSDGDTIADAVIVYPAVLEIQ